MSFDGVLTSTSVSGIVTSQANGGYEVTAKLLVKDTYTVAVTLGGVSVA